MDKPKMSIRMVRRMKRKLIDWLKKKLDIKSQSDYFRQDYFHQDEEGEEK